MTFFLKPPIPHSHSPLNSSLRLAYEIPIITEFLCITYIHIRISHTTLTFDSKGILKLIV